MKRGVAKVRLTSHGYGQEKPIADNGTDAGRTKNRRVQFAILKLDKSLKGTKPPPPPAAPPAPKKKR